MICIYGLEDFTLGVQGQLDSYTPGGVGPTAESMFMGQRYGMGIICVTHTLSGTSQIIRDNAETVIAFGLPGENQRLICDTFGATFEQTERIKTLRPGEFVILNPALWDKCVYATFEKPQIPDRLGEPTRRAAVESFLRQVRTSPPAASSVFKPSEQGENFVEGEAGKQRPGEVQLSSDCFKMLVLVATGPVKPATKVYELMGKSRAQGCRIAELLDRIGIIVPHRFSTGKVGGQLCFFEISEFGWQFLHKKGISKPKPHTNGGFEHELTARLIEASEKKQGRDMKWEQDLFGKRLDGQSVDRRTGMRAFFNIGVTDPVREVQNIIEILTIQVVKDNKLVFVARDAGFAKEVRSLLKAKGIDGELMRNFEIKLIADFMDK
jgi:hypothetical protein